MLPTTFPLYSGLVKNSSAVYRLLIKLGWDGERIELASFLEDTLRILHKWDENIDRNDDNFLFESEDFAPHKFHISNYHHSLQNKQSIRFHPLHDRDKIIEKKNKKNLEIYNHIKNRSFSLILYILHQDSDGTESIASFIWRREKSLIEWIEGFPSDHEFYIFHFDVFEFDLFENTESLQRNYQKTLLLSTKRDWYLHLLQSGWNGRSMNLLLYKECIATTQKMFQEIRESKLTRKDKERLLMYYFNQLNKKPSLVTNKTDEYDCVVEALEMHRELLEESLSFILSMESQSQIIAKCTARFSLTNTMNWRRICFPEEWIRCFCDYCEQTLL